MQLMFSPLLFSSPLWQDFASFNSTQFATGVRDNESACICTTGGQLKMLGGNSAATLSSTHAPGTPKAWMPHQTHCCDDVLTQVSPSCWLMHSGETFFSKSAADNNASRLGTWAERDGGTGLSHLKTEGGKRAVCDDKKQA